MPKFKIGKLVRDKVIQFEAEPGASILSDKDYIFELERKLLEEIEEIKSAKSRDGLREEIADLKEVLEAYIKAQGFEVDEITKAQDAKRHNKGGFDKRIYLAYAEAEPGSDLEKLFRDNPEISQERGV